MTLNDIVDELLSFEKKEPPKRPTFLQRIHNLAKRKEIEKAMQDEAEAENQRIIKIGDETQIFLNSTYYLNLVEPYLRQTIKGGIQTILREGEGLTEAQLKAKIAAINEALRLVASLKLKIMTANEVKEKK